MTNKDQRRSFYVVQFLELPFDGIDDYVYVPNSWLILRRLTNGKVVATYPNNEDAIDTRDRVRRKEKPSDKWRLYMARIKYKSDDYRDAENWIASKKNCGSGKEESEIKDTQQETEVNKKLRSASQSSWTSAISDKPQLTAKPYKNPRKPLPRITIKRPLSQEPYKNNKHLKLNENAKPGAVTDHTIIAPGCSKQEQSVIITDNKLIRQNDKIKISYALNGKMNTEQSTQPGVIKENQSVKMSIQSTSPKLTAEPQLSPQPTTDQKPSPHPLIDRQPSPKLIDEPHPSPKLSAEQQPLPTLQDYQPPHKISVADLDEFDKDIDRGSAKTLLNTLKQAPQSKLVNDKLTPLVHHEHSHPEPHPRDESAEQIKKFNDSQKTHLHWILTAPRIELRPPSTVNQPSQHLDHLQLPILPVSSTSNSEIRSLEYLGQKSFGVAGDHHTPCPQDFRDSTASTSYHGSNWGMQFEPTAKKLSAAVKELKNPVDPNTRVKGNSKNITMQYPLNSIMQLSLPGNPVITQTAPSTQTHFQQAQVDGSLVNNIRCNMGEKFINQKVPGFQGVVNTYPEQNFSNLAHQYRSFAGVSREQQYLPTQADYLSQFACMQDMLKRQTVASSIDPRVYNQNRMMDGGFAVPNAINQPAQFLPRNENQYIPVNNAYEQEVIRHDLMRGLIDGAHTTYRPYVENGPNVQLIDRYSSSQSHQNSKHSQQKQLPPIYRDPCTGSTQNDLTLMSNRSSYILEPQNIKERPRSLSTSKSPSLALYEIQRSCLLQEQGIQRIMNPNFTKHSNINLAAVPENLTVEPPPSTQEAEVQTMTLSEILHETQSTLIQRNHIYQHPRTKKTMVDQATETDLMMDVDHCIDKIAGSSVGGSASKLVDSACQTGEWLMEEQGSPYQETASDSETDAEQEIELENELDSEVQKNNLTNVRNVAPEGQQEQSKLLAEQDMLNTVGTLLTQMGTNLSITRDLFNFLRNSILVCAQEYKIMLEKIDKFNSIETPQIPIPPPSNEASEVQQVTQERPVGDKDNTTGVGDTVTPIREQRGKFSLPAKYDPNDTKWTLKYRENKPGLIELIPRTGVYVSKKELIRCIRQSSDCRTLARLLLTETFSRNALSVCSLTGGKAKAFNSVKIDVRPGLDEHARMVLLSFVEEHGKKKGWVTSDTPAIMSSIRTKIREIRAKHGQTKV